MREEVFRVKKEISAALIMLAFPILWIGGNEGNTIIAAIGILLLVFNACMIILPKKQAPIGKTDKKA